MAASASIRSIDNVVSKLVDLTCDAAYPTGGYPFTPTSLGFRSIYGVALIGNHPGIQVNYDPANQKLKLHATGSALSGALAELAANSAIVSTSTVLRLIVFGRP